MNGQHDPVDSAFDSLRSDDWSAQPFTKEMESQLMSQNSPNNNSIAKPALLVPVVGILALGAVGWASGGVEKLRTWFFDIEMEGANGTIVVPDGEEGTMIIERDDGTTTEIKVAANELDDGAEANVTVRTTGEGFESENVYDVIKRSGPAAETNIPLAKLEGADIIGMWSDEDRAIDLYAAPVAKGAEMMQLYVVTEGLGDNGERRVLAAPQASAFFRDADPQIDVDDLGVISIRFDTGDEVSMFKFATTQGAIDASMNADGPVRIDPDTGKVRVRVTQPE